MKEVDWNTVKSFLDEAMRKKGEDRETFVAAIGEASIRDEVISLLAAHDEIDDFIETPAFRVGQIFEGEGAASVEKRFGKYRIVREIGIGGMGAVFLAERDDGEFSHQVALKIIRQSVADRGLIERFKRERQILANLNHPNIAKLLDGGVSPTGDPFLVMEYIDGETLTDFVEQGKLDLDARLRLFLKICAAVQFAHRNLVVHRDIKPNNILVTAEGEPKLLDFGLARLTQATDVEHVQTTFLALTPAYASPEQLRNDPISTVSDIYSLGVVLYELLTGRRPLDIEGKNLETVAETVRNTEPSAPSARPQNETAANLPPRLLRGDLDNIVLCALRKEPARRYQSVEAFADDVRRHLDGLPVAARPSTFRYRTAKFIRRNRLAVIATALILASLVGGLIVSLRQTQRARIQEANALRQAEKTRKVTSFLEGVFNYANPLPRAKGNRTGGQARLLDILGEVAESIEKEFADDPDVQAELHHKVTEIYLTNGKVSQSLAHAARALELRRAVFGENHPETAKDKYYLASVYFRFSKVYDGTRLSEEAAATFREVDPENRNLPYLLEDVGTIYVRCFRDFGNAEKVLGEALELFRKSDGDGHFNTARVYYKLSLLLAEKGDLAGADLYFEEFAKRYQMLPPENRDNVLLYYKGAYRRARGELGEAARILEQSIAETGGGPAKLRDIYNALEDVYDSADSVEKNVALQRTILAHEDSANPNERNSVGYRNAKAAMLLARLGRQREAREHFEKSYAIYREIPPTDVDHNFAYLVASYLVTQNQSELAGPILARLKAFGEENIPPGDARRLGVEMLTARLTENSVKAAGN